jgi:DNA helicase IV
VGLQALDRAVSVLTVRESKGLEFDVVVLFEPDTMVAGSGRPGSDLYVAVTRTTQRLHILHSRTLPPGF